MRAIVRVKDQRKWQRTRRPAAPPRDLVADWLIIWYLSRWADEIMIIKQEKFSR